MDTFTKRFETGKLPSRLEVDVEDYATVTVQVIGGTVAATGFGASYEASPISGGKETGPWIPISGQRSNSPTAFDASFGGLGLAVDTPETLFRTFNVAALKRFRVRATALTAGNVLVIVNLSKVPTTFASPAVSTVALSDLVTEDAASTSGGKAMAIAGVRVPATPAAQTSAANDWGNIALTSEGKQIPAGQGAEEFTFQTWGAIPTAEADVRAAQAAGIRQYITDCTMENTSDAWLRGSVKDGAATVLFAFTVPPRSTVTHSFKTPLRGSAATAIRAVGSAAGLNMALTGYIGV